MAPFKVKEQIYWLMNLRLISVEYGMRIKALMTYKPKLLLQMNCGRKKIILKN